MSELRVVSLEDQIACVERELAFRARVYPRWVADKKLLQLTADLEMARMRAVLNTLQGLLSEKADEASARLRVGG